MFKQVIQFGLARAQTAGYQVLTNACNIERIDGYCTGASNCYLQLFDATAAPSANDVPKKSLLVTFSNGFAYTFLGDDVVQMSNGCYLALSTDVTKYTATAGPTVSGDITLIDANAYPGLTVTKVAIQSGVALYQVWASTTSPTKQLQRLVLVNNNAAAVVFCIIARDASTVGAKVIWNSDSVAAAGTLIADFGPSGLIPYEKNDDSGVIYQGCRVVAVLTSTLATSPITAGLPAVIATTDFDITATYATQT